MVCQIHNSGQLDFLKKDSCAVFQKFFQILKKISIFFLSFFQHFLTNFNPLFQHFSTFLLPLLLFEITFQVFSQDVY